MEKMTKAMWYDELAVIVEGSDYENKDGALEFIAAQKALLEAKAEKAKARAAAKKAEGDALRGEVEAALTGEFQTAEQITEVVGGEDVTKAKVVARLTQLVTAGIAIKEQIKGEDGRKVMNYRLAE